MSSLLTQNAELLLIKLIIADVNDVPYSLKKILFSCFGMKIYIIQLLTQGCPSTRDKSYLMKYILQRLIANIPAALYQYALALVSTGQCAAAMVHLNRSIIRGHLPSCALKAWMLINGREGVAKDRNRAYELVEEGAHKQLEILTLYWLCIGFALALHWLCIGFALACIGCVCK
jgi:hypothetical protein